MGPKEPRSTVLSREEEALIVAFRKHTLLPLDDCLLKSGQGMPSWFCLRPTTAVLWVTVGTWLKIMKRFTAIFS